MSWRIISKHRLDINKWDKAVDLAENSSIYGKSFYLNAVSENWDAWVFGDYQFVLPLPTKTKYGIRYVFQPHFLQRTAVYGKGAIANKEELVSKIDAQYLKIDLTIEQNLFEGSIEKLNLVIPLNKEIELSTNTKRNIKKAELISNDSLKLKSIDSLSFEEVYSVFKENSRFKLSEDNYKIYRELCETLHTNSALEIKALYLDNAKVSYGLFATTPSKATLLMLANTPKAKTIGGSHYLIYTCIKEFKAKGLSFDFEGSQNEGIARFYKSFGATKEAYFHYSKGLRKGAIGSILKFNK